MVFNHPWKGSTVVSLYSYHRWVNKANKTHNKNSNHNNHLWIIPASTVPRKLTWATKKHPPWMKMYISYWKWDNFQLVMLVNSGVYLLNLAVTRGVEWCWHSMLRRVSRTSLLAPKPCHVQRLRLLHVMRVPWADGWSSGSNEKGPPFCCLGDLLGMKSYPVL